MSQMSEGHLRQSTPFVPIKPKSKVFQLSGERVIVHSKLTQSPQIINEGTCYASTDVTEPVQHLIRSRWEEWREFVRKHRQMRWFPNIMHQFSIYHILCIAYCTWNHLLIHLGLAENGGI